jgi:hypothetical protein
MCGGLTGFMYKLEDWNGMSSYPLFLVAIPALQSRSRFTTVGPATLTDGVL